MFKIIKKKKKKNYLYIFNKLIKIIRIIKIFNKLIK